MLIKVLDDVDASQFFIKSPQQFVQLSLQQVPTAHNLILFCGSALRIRIQLFNSWRIRILVRLCHHKKYKILFEKDWSSGLLVNFLVNVLVPGFGFDPRIQQTLVNAYPDPRHCSLDPFLQGTVTPSHYVVVHNGAAFSADTLHKIRLSLFQRKNSEY